MGVLVAFLAVGACASSSSSVSAPVATTPTIPATVRIQITDRGNTHVVSLPLEDYVLGAVLAEVNLEGVDERTARRMLEVQALVARTYAMANLARHRRQGFDLCATTHCQLYRPAASWRQWLKPGRDAVNATRGAVLVAGEGSRPLRALFHANCGGYTSAANDVWKGEAVTYLQARPDPFCQRESPSRWRWSVAVDRLRIAFERGERSRLRRANPLNVVERDRAGRARLIRLGRPTHEISGTDLRALVISTFGTQSLRSTRFDVKEGRGTFVFEGTGHGHGVGLCQAGALARSRSGHSVQAIVEHYFPGSRIITGRHSRLTWPPDDALARAPFGTFLPALD